MEPGASGFHVPKLVYYNADGDRGCHGGHVAADVRPGRWSRRHRPRGLPGCPMHSRGQFSTLILPREAGRQLDDNAGYGQEDRASNRETCVFPDCGFGK